MVRVRVGPMELEVTGHAQSAEPGKDLVCCSLSVLTQTLAIYMEKLMNQGCLLMLDKQLEPGDAYIRVIPYGWSMKNVIIAFEVIRAGITTLAEDYPEYITLEEA